MKNWENNIRNFRAVDRDKYIIDFVKGKKVLHLGAADFHLQNLKPNTVFFYTKN